MDLGSNSEEDMIAKASGFFQKVYEFPKPTISLLNGPALGGGVGLAFTTDIRIAVSSCYFQLTEVKRGLVPALISKYIVGEIGRRATLWMLTGDKVSCNTLHQMGVITSVYESIDEASRMAESLVERIAEGAPIALQDSKRLVHVLTKVDADNEIKQVFERMMHSEEAAYGIQSFINKKKPDWAKL